MECQSNLFGHHVIVIILNRKLRLIELGTHFCIGLYRISLDAMKHANYCQLNDVLTYNNKGENAADRGWK